MPIIPLPPDGFETAKLAIRRETAGSVWYRIYHNQFPDPLGFGYGHSRFSDPTGKAFGLVYMGSSLKVSFHEVIIRDRGDGRIGPLALGEAELADYRCAEIEILDDLKLVDLTGDGPYKMGVPSDVIGARDQAIARQWSAAFFAHRDVVDGVYYPSRFNEERNIALYSRAIPKLAARRSPLLLDMGGPLDTVLDELELEID